MNITITFGTDDINFSVWTNSDYQNIIALYDLLSKVIEFNVRLVNLGINTTTVKPEVGLGINDIKHYTWDDVKEDTQLLIESNSKLNTQQTNYLKTKRCKIVSYKSGNSYISDLEDITFDNNKSKIINNNYDEIWILPHNQKLDEIYLKELYNTNVYTLPYIWSYKFIKEYEEFLINTEQELKYKIHDKSKNITILETNNSITNSSIFPILIINKVYKEYPSLINKVRVLNTEHLYSNNRYLTFVNNLDIFKDKKISFEKKHSTPFILSTVTDVVISHQWENELNNLYFDIFYGKYPLLHNSESLKGYGFYYDKFNIEEASKKLIVILNKYHLIKKDYNTKCEQVIYAYSINNQANINKYKDKIFKLMQ